MEEGSGYLFSGYQGYGFAVGVSSNEDHSSSWVALSQLQLFPLDTSYARSLPLLWILLLMFDFGQVVSACLLSPTLEQSTAQLFK